MSCGSIFHATEKILGQGFFEPSNLTLGLPEQMRKILSNNENFDMPYDDDTWLETDERGNSKAHRAAIYAKLEAPYDSRLWSLTDSNFFTPAHIAAGNGSFSPPEDNPLWYLRDKNGNTPAHFAAQMGYLNFPYSSSLWTIKNNDEETPLHWAAREKKLKMEYRSPLWLLTSLKNETVAESGNCYEIVMAHHITPGIIKNTKHHRIDLQRETPTSAGYLGALMMALFTTQDEIKKFWNKRLIDGYKGTHITDNPEILALCDIPYLIKNGLNRKIFLSIISNENLYYLYCTAIANLLSFLDENGLRNLLCSSITGSLYNSDSIIERLFDYQILPDVLQKYPENGKNNKTQLQKIINGITTRTI